MPELPEVEVCRKALAPALTGKRVSAVHAYCTNLRSPVPPLMKLIGGLRLTSLTRRSKYLMWRFENESTGQVTWLTTHLGMSGAWRLWRADAAPAAGPHDRLDIIFDDETLLRLTDPRKFSDIKVTDTDPRELAPLNTIGAEPFDKTLTPEVFYKALRGKTSAIKQVLLSGKIVCGCGNIYACESLFEARVRPTRKASKVTKKEAERLLHCNPRCFDALHCRGRHDAQRLSRHRRRKRLVCARVLCLRA